MLTEKRCGSPNRRMRLYLPLLNRPFWRRMGGGGCCCEPCSPKNRKTPAKKPTVSFLHSAFPFGVHLCLKQSCSWRTKAHKTICLKPNTIKTPYDHFFLHHCIKALDSKSENFRYPVRPPRSGDFCAYAAPKGVPPPKFFPGRATGLDFHA